MPVSRPATSSTTAAVSVMLRRPQRRRPAGSSGAPTGAGPPSPQWGGAPRGAGGRACRAGAGGAGAARQGSRSASGFHQGDSGGGVVSRIAPGGGSNESATPLGRLNSRRRPGAGGGGGGVGGVSGGAPGANEDSTPGGRPNADSSADERPLPACARPFCSVIEPSPARTNPPPPPVKSPSETRRTSHPTADAGQAGA